MHYVTYDETGALTGSYNQDLLPEHAASYIEVSEDEQRAWVKYRAVQTSVEIGQDESGNPVMADVWVLDLAPAPAYDLAAARSALVVQIDRDADAIYAAVIGNRTTEYQMAEADAQAFKDAGYTGIVPASVQCWADVKVQTAQWAADDILTTASAWISAQGAIRANRLARKEDARNAADEAAVAAVVNQWTAFVATIRAQLGVA